MAAKAAVARGDGKTGISVDKFLNIRRTFGAALSPDCKKILFISNMDGRYNLWTMPASGGWPHQVTFQKEMILGARWALGGKSILFSADVEGNENRQIYIVDAAGGEVENLTSRPDAQAFMGDVTRNGRFLAFSDNRRQKDRFDSHVLDLSRRSERTVLVRDFTGIDAPACFSRDGLKLLVYRDYHNLNSDVILVDLKRGTSRNLTEHEGDARFDSPVFSGDGKSVFVISDFGREFRNVMRIDLASGNREWFYTAPNDVAGLSVSPDGRFLCMLEDRRANLTPKIVSTGKASPPKIKWPAGLIGGVEFGDDGRTVLYSHQGPSRPADVCVADSKTGKHLRLTDSLVGGFSISDFVSPKYVSYRSFDGLEIHGLLYVPRGVKADGTAKAILWPHGGPNAHNQNRFSPWFQTFASKGYVVFAPDYRGSTGYGKSFQRKIFKDWGGGDLHDMIAAVSYLKESGIADPARIAVVGMSYGGFSVLTCITRAPDTFKAAVDAYGPANLFTFIDSNPPSWREGIYALVGHPERDREYLEDRSPIRRVDSIKTPLLVIQGKNDPRVAQAESDQIVHALTDRGREVEYIVYEDEGHGFSRKENEFNALKRTVDFLDRHV